MKAFYGSMAGFFAALSLYNGGLGIVSVIQGRPSALAIFMTGLMGAASGYHVVKATDAQD